MPQRNLHEGELGVVVSGEGSFFFFGRKMQGRCRSLEAGVGGAAGRVMDGKWRCDLQEPG